MITILSMLEKGYESSFEHLTFRQLQGAYQCRLFCVPHHFPNLGAALERVEGEKVFMLPPGRISHSTEFSDWKMPEGDVVFIFGSPQENLVSYCWGETALHITTKGNSDMMAVCVAAMVLYVHGQ